MRQIQSDVTVLMLGWELPPSISGGLGVACEGLLRSLGKADGVEIDFLMPQPHRALDDYPASVRIKGLPLYELGGRNVENPGEAYTAYRRRASHYAAAAARAQRDLCEFDLIHAHDWLTFEAGIAIKRSSGKPLVVHLHSTEHDRAGSNGIVSEIAELEAAGMREAERIIVVSNYAKECVIRDYGQKASKIDVVHNGSHLTPMQHDASVPREHVCFIGRITRQKGPESFVEAASMVLERSPDVSFVMAGDGNLLPRMRSLVSALGIADSFTFPGFIDQVAVRQLLMTCRVLVMPSLSEPFGLIGLEAICAGVPVVLSRNCGLIERVPSAIRVDPEDVESIADMISMLLAEQAAARRYAEHTRMEASNMDWDRSVASLLNVYEAILKR